jgi:YidC/Oxa1 family membrane protein insertase
MKYKGREGDQHAMMQQQAEMKAVYEKYGTSMTGGCAQLLIQMPIIFALYRVILNIPAYVSSVKVYFSAIVEAIGGSSAITAVNEFAHSTEELTKVVAMSRIKGGEIVTTDHIIDFLYHLNPSQWEAFKGVFSNAADVISRNYV